MDDNGKLILVVTMEFDSELAKNLKLLGENVMTCDISTFEVTLTTLIQSPSVLIFDEINDDCQKSIEVIEKYKNPPTIYIVTNEAVDFASKHNIQVLPYSSYEIAAFEISQDLFNSKKENNISKMERKSIAERIIQKLLLEIGFTPEYVGSKYIKDAVLALCIGDLSKTDCIYKVTYFYVGRLNDVSPESVERSIRTVINSRWDKSDPEVRIKYFGKAFVNGSKKPTNKKLIFALVDIVSLLIEEEIEKRSKSDEEE